MNMMKKTGGFTLVELIVVIAILAILAGIAVPVYSGYISKANEAADYTQLSSMNTAIAFAVAEKDPAGKLNSAEVNFSNLKAVTVDVTESTGVADITTVDISALFAADSYTAKSGATGAKWYAADDAAGNKAGWTLVKPTT